MHWTDQIDPLIVDRDARCMCCQEKWTGDFAPGIFYEWICSACAANPERDLSHQKEAIPHVTFEQLEALIGPPPEAKAALDRISQQMRVMGVSQDKGPGT